MFRVPEAPDWRVDWHGLDADFDWVRRMKGAIQDPIWHAEGDVWVHTQMVLEELAGLAEWRSLPREAQLRCWLGALLHDVAKPFSFQVEGDRVRSRGHSRKGAIETRRILWELGVDAHTREQVAAVVRHHQLPYRILQRPNSERELIAASHRCAIPELALVTEADVRGRICPDPQGVVDGVELFREYAREVGCWDGVPTFPSDHTRVLYFEDPRRGRHAEAYDDTRCTVTVTCGLPAAGKSTWLREHRSGLPVVSMDAIRAEWGVDPADDQGRVRQEARERARVLLRSGTDFAWDATNLQRSRRRALVQLCRDYDARVEIVVVEVSAADQRARNAARENPVPQRVLRSMLRGWQPPDRTEAHALLRV